MGKMDATLYHMPRGDLVSEILACPFRDRPILCLVERQERLKS